MGDPRHYLPPLHHNETINALLQSVGLPLPSSIKIPEIGGWYHRIYFLTFPSKDAASWLGNIEVPPTSPSDNVELVLRVAGTHITRLKTENEAAVIAWLSANTSIPTPEVVRYDASRDNVLGHEYLLQMRCPGVTAGSMYDEVTPEQMEYILDQLQDYMLQLWRIPVQHIGGFRFGTSSSAGKDGMASIVPGPCIGEDCWQEGDIQKYWGSGESFESLNAIEPGYPTFSEFAVARLSKNIRSIRIHDSMSWIEKQDLDKLERLVSQLRSTTGQQQINDVSFRLAHRDLHFWNFVIDPKTCQITGILDWEYAQCLPPPLANLNVRPFLNSCKGTPEARAACDVLIQHWLERLSKSEEGRRMAEDMKWKHPEQEQLWNILDYTRCVIEVCPRNEKLDLAREWWAKVMSSVEVLLRIEQK